MYEIEKLDLKKLKLKKLKIYGGMLNPGYTPLTNPINLLDPENKNLMWIGATFHNRPIGLAIVGRHGPSIAELHSFYVTKEHRDKNASILMLNRVEKECINDGKTCLVAMYPSEPPFLQDWEKRFIQIGWDGKRLAAIECYYADSLKFHPEWFEKNYKMPANFEMFFWKDILPAEAQEIKDAVKHGNIPKAIDPFQGDASFEPNTSLGLRHEGRVVAWIITRVLQPGTLCYFSIYAESTIQKQGPVILLLIQSIKQQQKTGIPRALFRVNVLQASTKWVHFVQRRLAPYTDKVTEFHQAWHELRIKKTT